MPHQKGIKSVAQNRKAWHDYFVEEKYECGLALFGTEVKSIRQGRVNLKESWAQIRGGEIWVGTTAGLYRYHRKTDRFGRNAKPKPESSLLGDNEITAVVEAEEGKLLIGMQNGYLGEFDVYTGRFTEFPAFDAEGKKLSVTRIHTIFRRDMNRYMICLLYTSPSPRDCS